MSLENPPARALSRPEFIALVAGLMALNALAIDIMLPALPALGHDLGVSSENEVQFVVTAYMLGFGAAQLLFGPISDRFGRRAPLFFGLVLYICCAVATTFAPTMAILLVLRFVQGLGAAATRVVAVSVVRDCYSGREMAAVMSLVFTVFMAIPIIAPSIGQAVLFLGSWHLIFLFMAGLAGAIGLWSWFRLPETLHPQYRRPLKASVIVEGFRIVVSNRSAFFYGLGSMLFFGAMFGFIVCSQQIFGDVYGLGPLYPLAFAVMGITMAIANFFNSRIVKRYGQRRVSHTGILVYLACGTAVLSWALIAGSVPLPVYYALFLVLQFNFALATSNMNALSMEPLGHVAGTAAAVFGFMQTVGGALIGTLIGQQFNGTIIPNSAGWVVMGLCVLGCVLIAERGRLFGVGKEYTPAAAPAE